MPELIYVANISNYLIRELNVLKESETHYYTHNKVTDKYESWNKSSVHLTKEGAANQIEVFHNFKVSELQNKIKAAESKLHSFKQKYNL